MSARSCGIRRVRFLLLQGDARDLYRAQAPAVELREAGVDADVVRTLDDASLGKGDVVVVRALAGRSVFESVRRLRSRGVFVVADADGHFEPPPYHPGTARYSSLRPYPELIMGAADLLVCATRRLSEEFADRNAEVVVVPSPVPLAGGIPRPPREAAGLPEDATVVVWGGTAASWNSLEPAAPALLDALERYERLWLLLFEGAPPSLGGRCDRVRLLPVMPYDRYLPALTLADIGIAPLEGTLFDACRTPSPLAEYGAAGLAAVSSGHGAYGDLARETAAVEIADGRDEWAAALSGLIEDAGARAAASERLSSAVEGLARRPRWLPVLERIAGGVL